MSWDSNLTGTAYNIAAVNAARLRVMAGPGTGKSFAMKRRVSRLLEEGADPQRVLAVTFTRTAAQALVSDLQALGIAGCEHIHCRTLHSFCFSVLMRQDVLALFGRMPRTVIAINARGGVLKFEAAPLLSDLQRICHIPRLRDITRKIRAFEAAWARQQHQAAGAPVAPQDQAFQAALLAWLRFHESMLIGEVVPETLRFFRDNPANPILAAYDHVIVDEFQDLNKAEQDLLGVLATTHALAVVGDEDQSIYSFRYAHPEGIREFHTAHPGTHDETLDECRRCPQLVVALADSLIRNNHPGLAQARLQPKADNANGEVRIVQWLTLDEEAAGITGYVNTLLQSDQYTAGDILILTPRRLIGYGIRDALRASGVPTHSFYHEEAVEPEDAQRSFTLLALLVNPNDRVALRWWLGHGSSNWRAVEYERLRGHCELHAVAPFEALAQASAGAVTIARIPQLLARFQELQQELAQLQVLGLTDLIDRLFPDGADWASTLRDTALLAAPLCGDAPELFDALRVNITQPEMPPEGDFVRVMSLHKSKGLTCKVTIVAGCIQGLIPHVDSGLGAQEQQEMLQEQRRLFYVAITRCTERLVLSSVVMLERAMAHQLGAIVGRGRTHAPAVASQFIAELGPNRPQAIAGATWRDGGFN